MKTSWLLQENLLDYDQKLELEIKKQGMECKYHDMDLFKKKKFDEYPDNACVIAHCSLPMARDIIKTSTWIPGVWCNLLKFDCSHYYPKLSHYLLNNKYFMLPYGELLRCEEFIFDTFAEDGKIFIRPNSGFKIFTGVVVDKERLRQDIQLYGPGIDHDKIVLVSSPEKLYEEWRLFIIDEKVIASSLYKNEDAMIEREGCPQEVVEYAEKVAKIWQPERAWVMDVCRTNRGFKVIEINAFSTSGFYEANLKEIVHHASRLALEEYNEFQ